jgi:hypothetical protein
MEEPNKSPPNASVDQSTKAKAEDIFNSIIPIKKYITFYEDENSSDTNWFGWGGLALFLMGSGGFLGYKAQTNDASASSVLLDKVISKERQGTTKKPSSSSSSAASASQASSGSLASNNSKPHPFIKQSVAASSKKVVEGPTSVTHVAVRGILIFDIPHTLFSLRTPISYVYAAFMCSLCAFRNFVSIVAKLKPACRRQHHLYLYLALITLSPLSLSPHTLSLSHTHTPSPGNRHCLCCICIHCIDGWSCSHMWSSFEG